MLKIGGTFVAKIFRGIETQTIYDRLCHRFNAVYCSKPKTSRNSSIEGFIVARGFGGTGTSSSFSSLISPNMLKQSLLPCSSPEDVKNDEKKQSLLSSISLTDAPSLASLLVETPVERIDLIIDNTIGASPPDSLPTHPSTSAQAATQAMETKQHQHVTLEHPKEGRRSVSFVSCGHTLDSDMSYPLTFKVELCHAGFDSKQVASPSSTTITGYAPVNVRAPPIDPPYAHYLYLRRNNLLSLPTHST
jgi:hypothetical protein